jgi:CheY-like chemotaxis protein
MGSRGRCIFWPFALGCLVVLAFSVSQLDAWFRSPELIFRWFALPSVGLALSCAFAVLPGSARLALAATLVTWGLLELGFSLALAWREARTESFVARDYYQPDPILGYAPKPGIRTRAWKRVDGKTLYDVEYEIDEKGRRVTPVDGRTERDRFLLLFGCSFAFGEGVAGDETLAASVARRAPRYVPYNYAFHGYGPHQLLAKLESGTLRGEVGEGGGVLVYALIGAHVSRTIGSMIVYTSWAHDAPYYVLDGAGSVTRRGTFTTGRPWTSLGYSFLGRSAILRSLGLDIPPVPTGRQVELTARVLARSQALFRESFGPQRFVVVVYPEHWPSRISERVSRALAREGVEYLDYSSFLGSDRAGYFFPEDRHPNARAHQAVAEQLVADLGLAGGGGERAARPSGLAAPRGGKRRSIGSALLGIERLRSVEADRLVGNGDGWGSPVMEAGSTRVLLVEDELVDAQLVGRSLRSAGSGGRFEVRHAATLAQGLEQLRRDPADVLLLDLGLPDSDGPETVARFRERNPRVPVVVFTGSDDPALAARTFEADADEYLVKNGFDGDLLRRTIDHAIERRRLRLGSVVPAPALPPSSRHRRDRT